MIDWVKRRFIRGMEIPDGGIVPPPTGHYLFARLAETESERDNLKAQVALAHDKGWNAAAIQAYRVCINLSVVETKPTDVWRNKIIRECVGEIFSLLK